MRVRKMTALMLAGAMTASMGTFAFADEANELPDVYKRQGVMTEKAEEGTDISALLNNFISIGSVRCAALGYQKD